MFEAVLSQKAEARRRPLWITVALSVGLHLALGAAVLLVSFWKIEKVQGMHTPVSFTGALAPPPAPAPPPPPPPLKKPSRAVKAPDPEPQTRLETVQPPDERPAPKPEDDEDDWGDNEFGHELGHERGQIGGEIGGDPDHGRLGGKLGGTPGGTDLDGTPVTIACPDGAAPPCDAPRPTVVPHALIEGRRVDGDPHITLPDSVKQAMVIQGLSRATATVELCLSAQGAPASIRFVRSTGFAEADARIRREMGAWRYEPYRVAGRAVPICTAVVFQYRLK